VIKDGEVKIQMLQKKAARKLKFAEEKLRHAMTCGDRGGATEEQLGEQRKANEILRTATATVTTLLRKKTNGEALLHDITQASEKALPIEEFPGADRIARATGLLVKGGLITRTGKGLQDSDAFDAGAGHAKKFDGERVLYVFAAPGVSAVVAGGFGLTGGSPVPKNGHLERIMGANGAPISGVYLIPLGDKSGKVAAMEYAEAQSLLAPKGLSVELQQHLLQQRRLNAQTEKYGAQWTEEAEAELWNWVAQEGATLTPEQGSKTRVGGVIHFSLTSSEEVSVSAVCVYIVCGSDTYCLRRHSSSHK
jgi:hypothetical protein